MTYENEPAHSGISIVCVFNNLAVREECLDRSIASYKGTADVDYLPIDNTEHAFSSAGAALNDGVSRARHDTIVFVHQDVYLHSIDRLVAVAEMFERSDWALLGASGVAADGSFLGRLRDRVILIGHSQMEPAPVDSVDEVLFMVPRKVVLERPLTEESEFAWHAYAVEYGLRMRELGYRTGAVDMAITHNSMTVNLDRLDVAHAHVGHKYPQYQPIRTTCGTIGSRVAFWKNLPVVKDHRWRARWLRESREARLCRMEADAPVVLGDIGHEVDLLAFTSEAPLHLVNIDRSGSFAADCGETIPLTRNGRPVTMAVVRSASELVDLFDRLPGDTNILATGLVRADLRQVAGSGAEASGVIGIQPGAIWYARGPMLDQFPAEWRRPRAVPLGAGKADANGVRG